MKFIYTERGGPAKNLEEILSWVEHQAVRPNDCQARESNISATIHIWSHRLTVRTPGFHPGNPGSIPGEITKEIGSAPMGWAYFF